MAPSEINTSHASGARDGGRPSSAAPDAGFASPGRARTPEGAPEPGDSPADDGTSDPTPVAMPEPPDAMPEPTPDAMPEPTPDAMPEPSDDPLPPATECGATDGATLRTLFVGNSQIYWADLPRIVEELAASAPESCARIDADSFTQGGANLRTLWENEVIDGRTLPAAIAEGGYQVVVITESIDLVELVPEPYPAQFVDYATRIADAARDAGAMPIFYATPYVETPAHDRFREMADPQLSLGSDLGVHVAAGGLAWLRVWDEQPDLFLYADDHAHPGYRGSYISALVIYAAITGASPIGLATSPGCRDAACMLSNDEAALYQRAAWAQHMETGR